MTPKPTLNWDNEMELCEEERLFKMEEPPELIDQLYEGFNRKQFLLPDEDPVCDNCKNRNKCSPKAKNLALLRNNDCDGFS